MNVNEYIDWVTNGSTADRVTLSVTGFLDWMTGSEEPVVREIDCGGNREVVGTGKWWEQGCGGNRSNNAWLFIISNNAWLFIISLNLGFGQFILLSLAWLLTAGSYLPLVPILRPGSYSQIYHLQGISTGIYVNVSISI